MRINVRLLLGPMAVIALWSLLSYGHFIRPIFLPKPHEVVIIFYSLISSGAIGADIFETSLRWLSGLFIGSVMGIGLGILMGASNKIYSSLEIIYDFFRSVPAMTLFPLFLLFFGTGNIAKIAISTWASLLFVSINTMYGVRHTKETRLFAAKVLGANARQLFIKIIIPGALPEIFSGIRIGISLSLVVVVASEMIMGTSNGLGKKIFDFALLYRTEEMFATIIITGMLGYLANKLAYFLETRLIHWRGK